ARQPGSSTEAVSPSLNRRARSIEKILSPGLVGATEIADDLSIDVKVVGLRPLQQPHPRLLRRSITLVVVAPSTAGHKIVPTGVAASRSRMNVIQGQVRRRVLPPAVLTRVVISQEDVLAREALSLERNMDVVDEPNHRRKGHREACRVQPALAALFGVRHSLQNENNRPADGANVNGLER